MVSREEIRRNPKALIFLLSSPPLAAVLAALVSDQLAEQKTLIAKMMFPLSGLFNHGVPSVENVPGVMIFLIILVSLVLYFFFLRPLERSGQNFFITPGAFLQQMKLEYKADRFSGHYKRARSIESEMERRVLSEERKRAALLRINKEIDAMRLIDPESPLLDEIMVEVLGAKSRRLEGTPVSAEIVKSREAEEQTQDDSRREAKQLLIFLSVIGVMVMLTLLFGVILIK